MGCAVCDAPALPLRGACAFCRSPLESPAEPEEVDGLLDYIAGRCRWARTKRARLGGRGVTEIAIEAGGGSFQVRRRRAGLQFKPDLPPAEWVDALVGALSRVAEADADVRSAVTRAGWALR